MDNNEKALNEVINKIQKKFRLNSLESCDRWMIKMFMNMKMEDLKNRIEVMPTKWDKLNPTRIHILEMAKIVYQERIDNLTK